MKKKKDKGLVFASYGILILSAALFYIEGFRWSTSFNVVVGVVLLWLGHNFPTAGGDG